MTQERSLGIVGGVGPESTADYYHRLIDRWKARRPDGSYPPILLNSLNSRAALGCGAPRWRGARSGPGWTRRRAGR